MTIFIGYEWRVQIRMAGGGVAAFPSGSTFASQIRATDSDGQLVGTLTSGDSTIVRNTDETLTMIIPDTISANMPIGQVTLDLVRTDLATPVHYGVLITEIVERAPTRASEVA